MIPCGTWNASFVSKMLLVSKRQFSIKVNVRNFLIELFFFEILLHSVKLKKCRKFISSSLIYISFLFKSVRNTKCNLDSQVHLQLIFPTKWKFSQLLQQLIIIIHDSATHSRTGTINGFQTVILLRISKLILLVVFILVCS